VPSITCLVGKNEAGKTALLQALYKLNPDIPEEGKFNLMEYPRRKLSEYKERHATSPDNVLTTTWELDDRDKKALDEKFGSKIIKNQKLTLHKGYDNQLKWKIELDEKRILKNWLVANPDLKSSYEGAKKAANISALVSELKAKQSPSPTESKFLTALNTSFPNGSYDTVCKFLEKRMPVFLFFSEFYKMKGRVSMDDLQKKRKAGVLDQPHRIFEALLQLVGASADTLNSIGKFEELTAELEAISTRLSDEIFEYWSQNKYLKVNFQFAAGRPQDTPPYNAGFVFHTRIENTRHGVTVSFDDRSAGFVWFFSFLVWFSQLKKTYGERLFILLDDPGLSLHARAQADLLRYIKEKLEPQYQVMYTTHSPFMIDPEKLMNVRTIEDVVTLEKILGSKVSDKALSVDPDTIFPMQAALGYDVTQTLFVGKHNLLVEGPSDLLYLRLFSKELQDAKRESLDPRWVITPCGGVEKIGSFVALFGGNMLHVATLTDFHKGIRNKIRDLRESQLLKAGHVFSAEMYTGGSEADIEDIIGRSNYIKLINECYSLTGTKKIPEIEAVESPARVIEEVEKYFEREDIGTKFDHFTPAVFLIENRSKLRELPHLDQALDRFERVFKDLNLLLPRD
jgi:predicted ATP-dependent endonuclease of OLD family